MESFDFFVANPTNSTVQVFAGKIMHGECTTKTDWFGFIRWESLLQYNNQLRMYVNLDDRVCIVAYTFWIEK